MLSGQEIMRMARKAARDSQRAGVVPHTVTQFELDDWLSVTEHGGLPARLPFPFIGTRRPRGFKPTGQVYFVDSSGWGSEGEPALTVPQFIRRLKVGMAYAVTEAGEFQVYVTEYEPPKKRDE